MLLNSIGGYLILAAIFKIIFIFMDENIQFSKVLFITFYQVLIGLLMISLNIIISLSVNKEALYIFTNFKFHSNGGHLTPRDFTAG